MTERRDFIRTIAAAATGAALPNVAEAAGPATQPPADDRAYWVSVATRLARPVLGNLAAGTLKARMPVEASPTGTVESRRQSTHLEAVGRLLCGIAPWLELGADATPEGRTRGELAELARRGLANAVNPRSPDFLNFSRGGQPLVDADFLAHAVVRAPTALWETLDPATRKHLVAALESSRGIRPGFNNWLLFSAMVETGLKLMGAPWDQMRVDYALRQHEQWYKGDGAYGDGPAFHWDYYNSFVIQPMMLDVHRLLADAVPAWKAMTPEVVKRARRYAAIQERLISPEGTFPPIGRSLAYRFGAFQLLAQVALRRELPDEVTPAQVRSALTAVIRRMAEAPGTFDREGWLTIGFAGHQPSIGESYISTGSVYLCAAGLLPLGLPASDPFWSAPAADWTSRKAWAGVDLAADHAI